VLRRLVTLVAIAGIVASAAAAASRPRAGAQLLTQAVLMPGVSYQRQVDVTAHGPVVLDVVTAPRPDGTLYTLAPALSNNAVVGTEKLTDLEHETSDTTTAVGVNGDFFAADPGSPTGVLMRGGALDFAPAQGRSSLGIAADGTLTVARLAFDGTWRGTGQRRQLDLNRAPVAGHSTLYTPSFGPSTPAERTSVVVDVLTSLAPLTPNHVATASVAQVGSQGGVPIPAGGAVLVSRGAQAPHLTAEAPVGTTVEIRPTLTPDWSSMRSAIGGGPLLVADGKPVFRTNESFGDPVLNARTARSAIGQLSDGRILLVTVEGGTLAYSAGMTTYELASALTRLGAVTAMGLGTGTAAAMAFDGTLLTRPSGNGEQPISDALVLSYTGVYAAPPSTADLSPNGDGVNDTQTFTYKLVRPAQVTATLVAPDGSTRTLAQDAEQPGLHMVQWNGETAAAGPEPEGKWRFAVQAIDDRGLTTTATRDFALDQTLGSLQVNPPQALLRAGAKTAVTATFQLVHAATVTVTVEKRSGVVIATLLAGKLDPGEQTAAWDGRMWTGSLAGTSPYQIHVTATNAIGKTELVAPFIARR
jgi:flagellar hook assembly protein FlgD